MFAENYANESKIPISALKQREARREIRERTANRTAVKPMHQPLRLGKLQRALKKLRPKRSPGPDGITNEMLIHLGSAAVCKLLLEQGVLPQIWREATMIPILKKGKDPKKANSYRPVSLTSCVVKTMERIVTKRLKWYWKRRTSLHQNRQDSDSSEAQRIKPPICLKKLRTPSKNTSWSWYPGSTSRKHSTKSGGRGYLSNC